MVSETKYLSENKPAFHTFKSKFVHYIIVLHSRPLQILRNILLYTYQTRRDIHDISTSLHFTQYLRRILIF